MRTFATDHPEFFCFKLDEDDETVYKIPLLTSMTNKEIKVFNETNGDYIKQTEWLRKYIGDIVDDLTIPVTSSILKEWRADSEGKGATLGES